jgi:NitT/TauT family transport system ATP-binding protein
MVSSLSEPEVKMTSQPISKLTVVASRSTAAAIHIDDVSVSFPLIKGGRRSVLENINLTIDKGEFVVLLGETGCGKSTLLRILLGQDRPGSGQVIVSGGPVGRVDARSSYVPQRYSLFPDRTVLENLMMGPETSRYHIIGRLLPGFRTFRKQVREEAYQQLSHMGLQASDAGKYPHQLSGGMQQRVAIAQALMMKSRVLLMDEAFSALDPATRSNLQRLLREVWSETRPTVVFVTHNTAEALFLGTRIIVLARPSREDDCGARVVLDRKVPGGGMSLRRHGQEFLDLVEHIESFSRGDCFSPAKSADFQIPEQPKPFQRDGDPL